ncbi:MAG: hypothetical protein IJ446_07520 [Oscillospiraceae bacterium]|nr:hypothetical protein [Oscillospiraceae bacterium]
MCREIEIAEKIASEAGALIGHGAGGVISFDSGEIRKKYFGGGGIRRTFYDVSYRSEVQKEAMEKAVIIAELFSEFKESYILSVKRSGISGKVSDNGIWIYSCRVCVEFYDETV